METRAGNRGIVSRVHCVRPQHCDWAIVTVLSTLFKVTKNTGLKQQKIHNQNGERIGESPRISVGNPPSGYHCITLLLRQTSAVFLNRC